MMLDANHRELSGEEAGHMGAGIFVALVFAIATVGVALAMSRAIVRVL